MTPRHKIIVIMLWIITCLLFVGKIASADELEANFDGQCLTVVWSSDIDEIGEPYMINISGYSKNHLWIINELFTKKDLVETRKICSYYKMDPKSHIEVSIVKLGETVVTTTIN